MAGFWEWLLGLLVSEVAFSAWPKIIEFPQIIITICGYKIELGMVVLTRQIYVIVCIFSKNDYRTFVELGYLMVYYWFYLHFIEIWLTHNLYDFKNTIYVHWLIVYIGIQFSFPIVLLTSDSVFMSMCLSSWMWLKTPPFILVLPSGHFLWISIMNIYPFFINLNFEYLSSLKLSSI